MTSAQDLVERVYSVGCDINVVWRTGLFYDFDAAMRVMHPDLEEIAKQFEGMPITTDTRLTVLNTVRTYLERMYVYGRLYEKDGLWHVDAALPVRIPAAQQPVAAQPADNMWDVW